MTYREEQLILNRIEELENHQKETDSKLNEIISKLENTN